ncbi:hypothetical protein [Verrucomicrobium sp. 3C]|uniref:hypothetical protein n=1 Tax=Verrucomicrobium sp. 3C TaxID=1134055 RepID=UPI00037EC0FD|nr:hypothetical protein [Verrucomicrobium sp. 3C]
MSFRLSRLCALLFSFFCAGVYTGSADGFRLDFLWKSDRKEERLALLRRGPYIRIDQPANLFSLIYNVELQSFLGLEHLDAHFWAFDWPTIRANTKASRENGWRLHSDPFQEDPTLVPFTPPTLPARAHVFHDLARFSWVRAPDRESRWIGRAETGEEAEILADRSEADHRLLLIAAAQQVKTLSQIFHFLLAREAWPEPALAIWLSLPEDAGIPQEMSWRHDNGDEGRLRLVNQLWREPTPDLFEAPRDYQRESLEEVEGFLP